MKLRTLPTILVLMTVTAGIYGHTRLIWPVPRVTRSLKVPPCGGIARRNNPLVLKAGEEIVVEWEEFIDHPGWYRILFSTGGDADFQVLLEDIEDLEFAAVGESLRYSATVTLPSTPCEEGTLLVIQVMTDKVPAETYYYSCADIRLVDPLAPSFRRADSNLDGNVDIADGIGTLEYLFVGGEEPGCLDGSDANDDGQVDVSDSIFTFRWLFAAGQSIPDPGPNGCGFDLSDDLLECASYPCP